MSDLAMMNDGIYLPYRYDFFVIWGNGLTYVESILDILRDEKNLEILKIVTHRVKNMKRFVLNLYGCDPVPLWHLQAKLSYLFKAPPETHFVFVKNLMPEENYYGEGPFRHIQCGYIKRIKEKIRNIYNPRVDGIPTEEHVIHATDYEAQVDYFLKMLGYANGILCLSNNNSKVPFTIPHHILRPNIYTFKTLPIKQLRASILVNSSKKIVETQLKKLDKTPHFRSLRYGLSDYEEYIERFKYTLLTDNHSFQKLYQLNQSSLEEIKNFEPIIVEPLTDCFQILDGLHRTTVTLLHGLDNIKCVEIKS